MELKKYKLGELIQLQRGYDLSSSKMKDGNVPVAGSNGIIGYHDEARSNHPCITVGRSGSVGKVHYYEQATWAHNTALFVKDFKGNNPKYLYCFLKNLHLDKMFDKGSSVVPSLDRKVVHSLNVPFIKDISYQKRVVAILSNLDRKIALNRAIYLLIKTNLSIYIHYELANTFFCDRKCWHFISHYLFFISARHLTPFCSLHNIVIEGVLKQGGKKEFRRMPIFSTKDKNIGGGSSINIGIPNLFEVRSDIGNKDIPLLVANKAA